MTPISAKAVQEVAPPAPLRADPPPAPKAPEMVAPAPAKAAPKPPKPIEKPADKSSARRPTVGPEIKSGAAASDTKGAPAIPFGGLTTGGGAGDGVKLDVENFCCPAYIGTMRDLIRQNWNRNQGAAGRVQVKFTIVRDGALTKVEVENGGNAPMLEMEAQRAVLKTRQLPPLPREFTESTLTVHLIFDYQR
jgi:TonB family protein